MAIDVPAPLVSDKAAHRSVLLVFAGLMVTMLLASLNLTVMSAALPTIVGELHGTDQMYWVITSYILASTIVMPIYGKLGDLFGRKTLLIIAICIFTVGSVIGAVSPNMLCLIVARTLQGVGAGGLIILSQATIADVVPARERGRYSGIMGAVFAISSVAGPLIGGTLTEGPGWRWVFWMNLPLGIIAVIAAVAFLHPPRKKRVRRKVDVLGMIVLGFATTGIVLVASWGGSQYAWTSPTIIGITIGTVIAWGLFIAIEHRAAEPVMPLALFKQRNFNLTTAGGLFASIGMFGAISYMPTYLQMALGVSSTHAGLLMVPMMGTMLLTSITTGRLVSRTGRYKAAPILGSIFVALALFFLSMVTTSTATWLICICLALLGAGLGASVQILLLIVQNTFPYSLVGTATAANNYFRQVGASLGAAAVGSLFASRLADLLVGKIPSGTTDMGDGSKSLTPELVQALPESAQGPIIDSYNDALMPVFLLVSPLAIFGAILLCFVSEKPLATTVEHDEPLETVDSVIDVLR